MKIGNWKTRSVFLRYAEVNDEDLAVAMNEYEQHEAERRLAQSVNNESPLVSN